ncbi:MAG: group III truncated hemoglobin [Arenicella sp.]|nr:group III truncated hemoglobin [Arenicella sp.]
MLVKDVLQRSDIEDIVTRFYDVMLKDPIVGFIFTNVANIDLQHHLPIIVDFWDDSLFKQNNYSGNTLQKHLDIHQKMPLQPGHFTRWLYLFSKAVDQSHAGENADLMKSRAELVAKSISAAIVKRKRGDMKLVL